MADLNLTSPLLQPSDHQPQVVLAVDPDQPRTTHLENPFEFIGSRGFSVPEPSTLDPFRNRTARIEGVYEWVKIVMCLPLALVRLLLFGSCLLIGYVATKLGLYGWKDRHNPMPRWRCRLMWVTRICTRCILFSFGYHWIKRRGRPAPRDTAPIVVSNHVSYVDPIFFFYELFPTIVASESHDTMPFVGTIIRSMQVIYVNRFSPSSRKHAVSEIKRKASCNRFPRVLLFPEGTTSNGRVLMSFQLGAFIPGYPIQPVVVRYPHVHFDQSWGHIALGKLMFRMFTQFHNFMETGNAIASALNVVQTSHSYGDLMLLSKASEAKQENPSLYMVEMAKVENSFHLSSLEAVDFLDTFLSMNPDPSGHVGIHDFFRVLRLKACNLSEKIFGFIDLHKIGRITFQQFLLGSAHVLKQPLFRQACELAFTDCDIDESHYMTEQEFSDSITLAIPNMNRDEMHELFKLFDTDSDGRICKNDFSNCLRRNPLLIALFSP
ncbi:hypothetical protein RJ640_027144, partial [Escallonia rubra]